MRQMKRVLILCVVFIFLLSLSGCDQAQRLEALDGTWYTVRKADIDTVAEVLQKIDLYEQELALLEDMDLQYCQTVEFREDMHYAFSCDIAASKPFFRVFFQEVFQQLFEQRAALSKLYWADFEGMSQDAFYDFYAQLYMQEDFDALLDYFTGKLMVAESQIMEEGTFSFQSDTLLCTPTQGQAYKIPYQLDESGNLLLIYSNGNELYTHDIP